MSVVVYQLTQRYVTEYVIFHETADITLNPTFQGLFTSFHDYLTFYAKAILSLTSGCF